MWEMGRQEDDLQEQRIAFEYVQLQRDRLAKALEYIGVDVNNLLAVWDRSEAEALAAMPTNRRAPRHRSNEGLDPQVEIEGG